MKDITPSFTDASNELLEKLTGKEHIVEQHPSSVDKPAPAKTPVPDPTWWDKHGGAATTFGLGVGVPLAATYLTTKMMHKMQDERQEDMQKKAAESEEEPSNSEGGSDHARGYDRGYDRGYGQGYEDAKKEAAKSHQLPRIPRHRRRA